MVLGNVDVTMPALMAWFMDRYGSEASPDAVMDLVGAIAQFKPASLPTVRRVHPATPMCRIPSKVQAVNSLLAPEQESPWRRRAESNRRTGLCRGEHVVRNGASQCIRPVQRAYEFEPIRTHPGYAAVSARYEVESLFPGDLRQHVFWRFQDGSMARRRGPEAPSHDCPSMTDLQDTSQFRVPTDRSPVAPWVWTAALQ